jgi:hypothetical protein
VDLELLDLELLARLAERFDLCEVWERWYARAKDADFGTARALRRAVSLRFKRRVRASNRIAWPAMSLESVTARPVTSSPPRIP